MPSQKWIAKHEFSIDRSRQVLVKGMGTRAAMDEEHKGRVQSSVLIRNHRYCLASQPSYAPRRAPKRDRGSAWVPNPSQLGEACRAGYYSNQYEHAVALWMQQPRHGWRRNQRCTRNCDLTGECRSAAPRE